MKRKRGKKVESRNSWDGGKRSLHLAAQATHPDQTKLCLYHVYTFIYIQTPLVLFTIWPAANLESSWYWYRGALNAHSLLKLSVFSANLMTIPVSNILEPVSVGGHWCNGMHDSGTPCNDKLPFLYTTVTTVVGESTTRWQRWGLKFKKGL